MGSRNADRIPLIARRRHGETVADMIANGWDVYAQCPIGRCSNKMAVNLRLVASVKGPGYSLWNRRPKCRRPGCDGKMLLWARAPGMPAHEGLIYVEQGPVKPAWKRGRG